MRACVRVCVHIFILCFYSSVYLFNFFTHTQQTKNQRRSRSQRRAVAAEATGTDRALALGVGIGIGERGRGRARALVLEDAIDPIDDDVNAATTSLMATTGAAVINDADVGLFF